MPRLQFTPWKEPSELLSVRSQFYPSMTTTGEPADMRARACSTVWVWKLRGNLPHTVEATALLTDAILHDDARKNSIFSIRATYSAAFCRFVTGLVDSKLYGRRQTMFQRAMELGLPASFVELRHEATHRELPALVVLRDAARRSLEWLWEFYWDGLGDIETADAGMDVLEQNRESQLTKNEIQQMLKNVVLGESNLGENSATRRSSRKLKSFPGLENVALILKHQQGEQTVTQVLLEEGILIPASRTLGSSMEATFSTWDVVLKELCRHRITFLTSLSGELARALVDEDSNTSEGDPYREAIYLWLVHIFNSSAWAAARRLYLSTCHVDAACHDASGYWARRLRSSMDQHSHKLDTDATKEANSNGTSELGTGSGAATLGKQDGSVEEIVDMDADLDSNLLRSYGWDVKGSWKYKPIGVV
ncbi:cell morphogenesis protein Las1 [Blastomyces gilchristii SLH14081]|uniref:Cell morphogenesis protein Las1 n=1 Tax=Blastomyces gilchristii (strain SLH14081) TaxID=559298 RepID=A0A179UYV2_BLAGS|nr:cell morphogenesis protein Las1 [Blastomyces gilchristii SLH14081]OAT13003.1 cell morphogenesis protein Las1 [Blastomyces gilchristii SLH14081]